MADSKLDQLPHFSPAAQVHAATVVTAEAVAAAAGVGSSSHSEAPRLPEAGEEASRLGWGSRQVPTPPGPGIASWACSGQKAHDGGGQRMPSLDNTLVTLQLPLGEGTCSQVRRSWVTARWNRESSPEQIKNPTCRQ